MNDDQGYISEKNSSNDVNKISIKQLTEEQKQTFLNGFESYEEAAKNTIAVRPWLDGDDAKKPSLNLITQFALYKCMHDKCIYATDKQDDWVVHMDSHIKLIDIISERYPKLPKIVRDKLKKFRECPYCDTESKSNADVVRHMVEDHSGSIFQCAHCYYRTIEMDNIVLHYETFHANKPKEILLYGIKREYEEKHEEEHRIGCLDHVDKIKCGQGNIRCDCNGILKM